MKVHKLGEFGLIQLLTRIAAESGANSAVRSDLVIGIGDDAAAWQGDDMVQLGTTDILVQNVHFTLETTSWHDLGWKSLAVNISDIAAMGGVPGYAMISLGLPPNTDVEHITELYRGMAEIARRLNMVIAGGDITEAPVLVISPSVIGKIEKDRMMTRSGAKAGDRIAVTGYLGASVAGLRMMQENLEFDSETASALREAHLRPSPRVTEGRVLSKSGVRAAIDISDGLIADLGHICEMSKVGARIRLMDVPIHPAVKTAFGEDALNMALTGGEDYELLFTAPGKIIEEMQVRRDIPAMVTVIGEIVEGDAGKVRLFDEDGKEVEWENSGWEHFNS